MSRPLFLPQQWPALHGAVVGSRCYVRAHRHPVYDIMESPGLSPKLGAFCLQTHVRIDEYIWTGFPTM